MKRPKQRHDAFPSQQTVTGNLERFTGIAGAYDAVRPQPPAAALDVLCEIVGTATPPCVVDLGAGTGLSARIWIGRAERIIGIEPNADMRRQAEQSTPGGAVEFRDAMADATGLPDGCADLVTCVQALHWLDPEPTFAEVHRLLRPGGAFAALDCDWPPFVDWRLVGPWQALHDTADRIVADRNLAPGLRSWEKSGHIPRLRASGYFREVFELGFHARTSGDATRLLALARSQGGLATALKASDPEAMISLTAFAERVTEVVGDRVRPWTYTYRMRVGVKEG